MSGAGRRRPSRRSLTKPLSGLPTAPAAWQTARRPPAATVEYTQPDLEVQHHVRQRRELDHAQEHRRETEQEDVAERTTARKPGRTAARSARSSPVHSGRPCSISPTAVRAPRA